MQFIEPSVEIITEDNPFKKIELAGRTCYKSEKNITDESAVKFYNRLLQNEHFAMLEHATFVFETSDSHLIEKATRFMNTTCDNHRLLISGNLRAIIESNITELKILLNKEYPELNIPIKDIEQDIPVFAHIIDFESLPNPTDNEIRNHRYTTMRFITNRGVSHELVRHRLFSFAQESTRYVRYDNNCMQFTKPEGFDDWSNDLKELFIIAANATESYYKQATTLGAVPQDARWILSNGIKTEIVVTGDNAEWQHFFDLRSKGTTGKPHPDMKRVADIALQKYESFYETK